jgi:hypothetical protein
VSLIVDTKGTYQAAITRKLKLTKKVTVETSGVSYEFFGEGKKALTAGVSPVENVSEETAIQYFMLDVEVEKVENPLDYLDTRFDEIEAKKKAAAPPKVNLKTEKLPYLAKPYTAKSIDKDEEFFDWLHSSRNESATAKEVLYSEPTVFDSGTMQEMVDFDKWNPDPTIIHYLVCQLVTCSLIVGKDIDLKQWVTKWMEKKYNQIFDTSENVEFNNWAECYIEFIIGHYSDDTVPDAAWEDFDTYQGKIAEAIVEELAEYPSNNYIEVYIEILSRYAV